MVSVGPGVPPQHPQPPFDPWRWLQALQETWWAGLDPVGIGRHWRCRRLEALLASALRDSPLYARRSHGAHRLEEVEPIGKPELMAHFDDWATDRRITRQALERMLASPRGVADAWLDRYLVWSSSGTSGQPGLFVQDAASLAAYDAIDTLRLRGSGPLQPGLGAWGLGRRFAYVGALGGPYAGHVSLERLRRLAPAPWAPQVEMISVLEPLERIAARLQALQPQVLITYPSCAVALAPWQAGGRLRLALDEIWLGGEQLSAAQRHGLKTGFGCAVRSSYGASEFYSMAFECAHGRLHLNDDWVILEAVDAHHRPVPAGEFSAITLLTNLANLTQPLLRYELTDRVRYTGAPCDCGSAFPVIEVQGRSDDALALPAVGGGTVTLLPLVLETVLEEEAGVDGFQLLRHPGDRLELRLPSAPGDARPRFEACRDALLACLARHGVKRLRIVRGGSEPVRDAGSGKLRRVIDPTRSD